MGEAKTGAPSFRNLPVRLSIPALFAGFSCFKSLRMVAGATGAKEKFFPLKFSLSLGNSKVYLGKEYTEQQINQMDCTNVNTLLNRYESLLSAKMTKSLGKSIINLYSNLACSVLGVGNQQELSTDLECDPFLNTAMQRFTCDLYYLFGTLLAPVSVGIITGKHYAKNYITKLNDRSDNGTSDTATRNCNQTEEPSEN